MIPPNDASEEEFQRILEVSELDLDYQNLQEMFKNLTKLACKITGAELSLVNILDSYWQWSIAANGIQPGVMPREQSVCQYTIGKPESFEVNNFRDDERFNVPLDEKYSYYFGVALKSSKGNAIGALCIIDEEKQEISSDKKELLKLIGAEISEKLESLKKTARINTRFHKIYAEQRELGYELRGPVSGILGLSKLAQDEEDLALLKKYFALVGQNSNELIKIIGNSLEKNNNELIHNKRASLTILELKNKLEEVYYPLAKQKNIELKIDLKPGNHELRFSRQKIIQVAGNLISNAIKFNKEGSQIKVSIGLKNTGVTEIAKFSFDVEDFDAFLPQSTIEDIMQTNGKANEKLVNKNSYGVGLKLARHMVLEMGGQIEITSEENSGSKFFIAIPRFV